MFENGKLAIYLEAISLTINPSLPEDIFEPIFYKEKPGANLPVHPSLSLPSYPKPTISRHHGLDYGLYFVYRILVLNRRCYLQSNRGAVGII